MRRNSPTTVLLGVATIALAACASEVPPAASDPDAGSGAAMDAPLRTPPILQDFAFGGDFSLTSHTGEEFKLAEHRGEVFLLFFGYTSCPDYCPTTMSMLTQAVAQAQRGDERATVLFVSIDNAVDTPDKLAEYLGYFDVPAIGLTGTTEQLEALAAQYAASFEMLEEDGERLFGHTTYTYLIGKSGQVRFAFRADDTVRFVAAGIDLAMSEAAAGSDD